MNWTPRFLWQLAERDDVNACKKNSAKLETGDVISRYEQTFAAPQRMVTFELIQ
jgi:hypothetical protein